MSKTQEYLRFTRPQRIEHWVMVISFSILAITGLPQKFAGDGWAETLIRILGGIEFTRVIHHIAAIVLLLGAVYHFISLIYRVYVLRVRWTIFPQLQDVVDAINSVTYNLGIRKEAPRFDQFSFGEKFEYWALIWGTLVMAITGFMLWNPIITSRIMPGEMVPAAKAAHGAEAILAVLSVLVWHFYNVHIRSFNTAMFTGKASEHMMEEEHSLQLALLEKKKVSQTTDPAKIRRRQRAYLPVALVIAALLSFGVFMFVTAETTAVTTIRRQAGAIVTIYAPQTKTPTPPIAKPGSTVQPSTGGIPALPANHAGRTTCTACHDSGIGGAPKSPADHKGRTDATCADCHKPQGAASASTPTTAATAAATTAATAAATTAATTAAPTATTASSSGPKALPADHAGRTTCTACHDSGVAGAPKSPADHAGRTDATCTTCHKPASSGATAADTPAATAVPAATATTASTGSGPAAQPASHAGRTTCLACHQTGVAGAPAIPGDHAGRTDAMCAACHKPQ